MLKVFFNEIMKLPTESKTGNLIAINILQKHAKVELERDEKENIIYTANVNDLLLSDLTEEELMRVRDCGWCLTEDGNKILKKL